LSGSLLAFLIIVVLLLVNFSRNTIGAQGDYLEEDQNSQNMALLSPGVSLSSLVNKASKEEELREDVEINIIGDNALLATVTAVSIDGAIGGAEFFFGQPDIYVVRDGDGVGSIAEMFGVTKDTIYSANEMKKGAKIKKGDVLLILPFSGVKYTVAKGDTLQGIANKHKTDVAEILVANEIENTSKISIGMELMIPGASIALDKPKRTSSRIIAKSSSYSIPVSSGYFINPLPGGRKTRGVKAGHYGVDIAAPKGTPILAATDGLVLIARNGYNGGYGKYVVVEDSSGIRTLYAHMSQLGTSVGAGVKQGQVIGYVGSTGKSTGNHVHFEVRGARNPF